MSADRSAATRRKTVSKARARRRGDPEKMMACDELVEVKKTSIGKEKDSTEDGARKAAQKAALAAAAKAAGAAAATILEDYDCADEDCPNMRVRISYTFGKPKFKDVDIEGAIQGMKEAGKQCTITCRWIVTVDCVADQ